MVDGMAQRTDYYRAFWHTILLYMEYTRYSYLAEDYIYAYMHNAHNYSSTDTLNFL